MASSSVCLSVLAVVHLRDICSVTVILSVLFLCLLLYCIIDSV